MKKHGVQDTSHLTGLFTEITASGQANGYLRSILRIAFTDTNICLFNLVVFMFSNKIHKPCIKLTVDRYREDDDNSLCP